MIIVTPNPAIDRTLLLLKLELGSIHRPTRTIVAAGGKGLNAARAAKVLGANPLCMGFLGGPVGRHLAELADNEGLRCTWTWSEAETRSCTILSDGNSEPTVIYEPGKQVPDKAWEDLAIDIFQNAHPGEIIAFCGSLPAESDSAFRFLLDRLNQSGYCVWVDSSGTALKAALQARVQGIKINLSEACELIGTENSGNMEDAMNIGRKIHQQGIKQVVLTLGARGALYFSADQHFYLASPPVKAISNVGSGDSFFGVFLLGLERGISLQEAFSEGIAAGVANTLSAGGGRFSMAEFSELRSAIPTQMMSGQLITQKADNLYNMDTVASNKALSGGN